MKKLTLLIALHFLFLLSFSQHYTISGTISNKDGNPLYGANVQIQNSNIGTFTNEKGNFVLNNVKEKKITLLASFIGYKPFEIILNLNEKTEIQIVLKKKNYLTDEVIVSSTRAGVNTPVSYCNLNKKEINNYDTGQDLPFLLNITPSLITNSDAGTGIGYTNFRIRGTDMNRINITLNGIPVNDAESHGVWFVDLPDVAGSVDNIQIQRGVGTSVNGAASFGASINMQTTTLNKNPNVKISSSAGSFNTFKNSVSIGTGLINNHFTFDARLSKINSDGYIDRAWAKLKSYYLSAGYYSEKSILKLNILSGLEDTYQAWYGIPSEILDTNRTYNYYNYDNEIDHYQQNHYQLLFSHQFNSRITFNSALHYTKGNGYYEQYKDNESLSKYGLEDVIIGDTIIENTDLIRRKWLDNDFYGFTYSVNYKNGRFNSITGGGWNKYIGNHFGRIIWAKYASNGDIRHQWYYNLGTKSEFNFYQKINYKIGNIINIYGDIQLRNINYKISGTDDDNRDITQSNPFLFINPKCGFYVNLSENQSLYYSFGIANREPSRSTLVDANPSKPKPTHETLYDYEFGYNYKLANIILGANIYYMNYKNQLVLTGEINDVGGAVMTNIPKSYRSGIELTGNIKLIDNFTWNTNITLSRNKILNFVEFVDNWDYWSNTSTPLQYTFDIGNTPISFSPEIIIKSEATYKYNNLVFSLISSYVGKQQIDNTGNSEKILNPYFLNNLKLSYGFSKKQFKNISVFFLINNIADIKYETNAWIYSYYSNSKRNEMDGYFPQAERNYMGGIILNF